MEASAKFPRIAHLPWSPGGSADDLRAGDAQALVGLECAVTEKMDGANSAATRAGVFARTHAHAPAHPQFDHMKAWHAGAAASIPEGVTLFMENCFAVHSVEYRDLPSWLLVIGARDDARGVWLSLQAVRGLAEAVGLPCAPALWGGTFESAIHVRHVTSYFGGLPSTYGPEREGVVVRPVGGFLDAGFGTLVLKWVRKEHLKTGADWASGPVRRQPLGGKA